MKHRFLGILALVVNEKTYFCTRKLILLRGELLVEPAIDRNVG